MNVAVVNLTAGGLSGGYRKYLEQLLPLLRADPRVKRLDVFVPPGVQLAKSGRSELRTWPVNDERAGHRGLRTHLRQLSPDVVFIPTGRSLACGTIPTVIMIRNMEPLMVPFGGNSLRESLKNLARAYAAWRACRRATRVLAVSGFVRDFLVERWKIGTQKIGLVYHGIETAPLCAEAIMPRAVHADIGGQFLFTAGSIRPARGLEDAIRAMAKLSAYDPSLQLLIGGKPDRSTQFYEQQMQHRANKLGVGSRVVWLGQLSALEMSWCYYHCAAFVMTSRAEACPNTALEAMSHGCQIVSTRQPPMPEFFGESASYYTPTDGDNLANKIRAVLAAAPDQQRLRQHAAQQRASQFKWSHTAQQTIEQLERAMARCDC